MRAPAEDCVWLNEMSKVAIHKLFGIETVSQCYKSLGVMLRESEASALPRVTKKQIFRLCLRMTF